MSKIITSAKVTEKFAHFKDVHFEDSVCVNLNSLERCIYILERKFRINSYVCAAIDENGEVIPLNLDNLTIAAKSKYSSDFVGYLKLDGESVGGENWKFSPKHPYDLSHSFVFAFVCNNVVVSVLLTKPVATDVCLSGISIDIGLKDNESNCCYNKVMESISAICSLIKSTALKNVKNDTAFAGLFETPNALLCKSEDKTVQSEQQQAGDQYD